MAKRTTSAKACKYVQLYAKLLETDENGYGYCCSCGDSLSWNQGQGGHFHPKGRNYPASSFMIANVHLQCSSCNCGQGGNPSGYSKYMDDKYGKVVKGKFTNPTVDEINTQAYVYLDTHQVQEIAHEIKQKCIELIKTKSFEIKLP
jgi:hypothetical protein